ncbi:MAG: hypothetical protein V4654_12210 [Bdellovibrionota bacterium]
MKILILLSISILLIGCTSISKNDFTPQSTHSKLSPLIGHIQIVLDGDDFMENCSTFWKIGDQDEIKYSLDKSGDFMLMAEAEKSVALTKVQCVGFERYNHSFWPTLPFSINGALGDLTYIGELKLIWNTKWNANPVALLAGLVAPTIGASSIYSSGTLNIEVRDEQDLALTRFRSRYQGFGYKPKIALIKFVDLPK